MAAYLNLTNKKTGEKADLQEINKEIYDLLGFEYDSKRWCKLTEEAVDGIDWYNIVGLALAMSKTYNEIRELFPKCKLLLKVVDYLEANYNNDSYFGF